MFLAFAVYYFSIFILVKILDTVMKIYAKKGGICCVAKSSKKEMAFFFVAVIKWNFFFFLGVPINLAHPKLPTDYNVETYVREIFPGKWDQRKQKKTN